MIRRLVPVLCVALFLVGCSGFTEQKKGESAQSEHTKEEAPDGENARERKEEVKKQEKLRRQQLVQEAIERVREKEAEAKRSELVVLDPGHSGVVAEGSEPLGPGASEYKAADSGGTSGVSSGVSEAELNLTIAIQLKTALEERGYTVIMTRESNEVPISCLQRAEVANNAQADAYVRIHANGSVNQAAQGAMTICTTQNSPYVPELYVSSRRLSDCILDRLCEATGCVSEGVWETDTMSGNNWSQVPVTIVEVGYMSNPEEDMLMQTAEYQTKIVRGIANGIDEFLGYEW